MIGVTSRIFLFDAHFGCPSSRKSDPFVPCLPSCFFLGILAKNGLAFRTRRSRIGCSGSSDFCRLKSGHSVRLGRKTRNRTGRGHSLYRSFSILRMVVHRVSTIVVDRRKGGEGGKIFRSLTVSNGEDWSRRAGLNRQPADYESAALPLSYVGPWNQRSVAMNKRKKTVPSKSSRFAGRRIDRAIPHSDRAGFIHT